MKLGDTFTLECGHEGKIVWMSQDAKTFFVKGASRSCRQCGKKSASSWTPTVYAFSNDDE